MGFENGCLFAIWNQILVNYDNIVEPAKEPNWKKKYTMEDVDCRRSG